LRVSVFFLRAVAGLGLKVYRIDIIIGWFSKVLVLAGFWGVFGGIWCSFFAGSFRFLKTTPKFAFSGGFSSGWLNGRVGCLARTSCLQTPVVFRLPCLVAGSALFAPVLPWLCAVSRSPALLCGLMDWLGLWASGLDAPPPMSAPHTAAIPLLLYTLSFSFCRGEHFIPPLCFSRAQFFCFLGQSGGL